MQPLVLLTCLAAVVTVAASNSNSRHQAVFGKVPKCPPDSASYAQLRRLQGSHDDRTCFVECASVSTINCSVMHRAQDSVCYFGTAEQLGALFVETGQPDCVSHVRISNSTTSATPGPPDAGQIKTTLVTSTITTSATIASTTTAITTPTTATPTATTPTATTPTATTPSKTEPATTLPSGLSLGLFSKLLILFDFRQGLSNLANPSKYAATIQGSVSRDSEGAHFSGASTDFIEVDTDGGALARDYLDDPSNFTFFARVLRRSVYEQSYHYFYDCSGGFAGTFGDRAGQIWVDHPFPSQTVSPYYKQTRSSIATPLSTTTSSPSQLVSSAAVFTGRTLSTFYFNNSILPTNADLRWGRTTLPSCLRLGFHDTSSKALKGLMMCYAIAKDALELTELQQLEKFCSG